MAKKTSTHDKHRLIEARVKLLKMLSPIGAYLYYAAVSGSQYIKFSDPRIGSLRVADHNAKEKYHYRWNFVLGGIRKTVQTEKTIREFYAFSDFDGICGDINKRAKQLIRLHGEFDTRKDPYGRSSRMKRKPKSKKRHRPERWNR